MARQSFTLPGIVPVVSRAARVFNPATGAAILAFLTSLGVALPARAVGINDTGQTNCYDGAGTIISCDLSATDGRYGRDAAAAAGVLVKTGGGVHGFDFTRIGNNGLPTTSTTLGNGPTDWACTLDNTTGIFWEMKTDDGGLRDKDWEYTWRSSDPMIHGGDPGYDGINSGFGGTDTCGGSLAAYSNQCNTETYAAALNALALNGGAGLCNRTNWRMPTEHEVAGIIDIQLYTTDPAYFPNRPLVFWWTGTTVPNTITFYDQIGFAVAAAGPLSLGSLKDSTHHVQLVSDPP